MSGAAPTTGELIQTLLPDMLRKYSAQAKIMFDPSVDRWIVWIQTGAGQSHHGIEADIPSPEALRLRLENIFADHAEQLKPREAITVPDLPKPFRMPAP